MSGRLVGKVAIVTAATAGVGREICRTFVRQGARIVVVTGAREAGAGLAAELGGDVACWVAADVSAGATAVAAIAAGESLGPVQVLVNIASADVDVPLLNASEESRERAFDEVFFGPLRTLREAARVMAGHGGGSIVNVPARTAVEKPAGASGVSIRSASQGALESLSRAAAVELAPLGVRVNVIAPGPTRTLGNDDLLAAQPDASRVVMGILRSTPQRRLGLPEDVAAAAVYLASDESRHVTGVVLHVDGGLAAAAAGPA